MRLAMSKADRHGGRGGHSGRGRLGSPWDLLEYLDDFGSKSRAGEEDARRHETRRPLGPRRRTSASVVLLRSMLVLDLLASLLAILYALLTA